MVDLGYVYVVIEGISIDAVPGLYQINNNPTSKDTMLSYGSTWGSSMCFRKVFTLSIE